MDYNNCLLYSLQSKKKLRYLLGIKNSKLLKQDSIVSLIEPYIDDNDKPRLIEAPQPELKIIQKRIKNILSEIVVPGNIFSGIKGRSYADNAFFHIGDSLRYLFKIDLKAFFPSIGRETVYKFFREDLLCSPDIAQILTNFTTIDLSKSKSRNIDVVKRFLDEKGVTCYNHLISGAPTSQILSYLVNHKMFDELQTLADERNITMTVYVDDVTFSSENHISVQFKKKVFDVIKKYNYQVSKKKVKNYSKLYPKLVTGVIIDATGKPTIKNSLRKKIADEYGYLRKHPDDTKSRQRLRGFITAARQVDKSAYPFIRKFAFSKPIKHNGVKGTSDLID